MRRRRTGAGPRASRLVGLGAVLVLIASGCSGSSDEASPSTTSGGRPATSSADGTTTTGETTWLEVPAVGRIQMATIGSGDKAVVFLHQTNRNGMCGFRAYAERLAEQGVRSKGVHGWALLGEEDRWTPLADTVQQVVLGG